MKHPSTRIRYEKLRKNRDIGPKWINEQVNRMSNGEPLVGQMILRDKVKNDALRIVAKYLPWRQLKGVDLFCHELLDRLEHGRALEVAYLNRNATARQLEAAYAMATDSGYDNMNLGKDCLWYLSKAGLATVAAASGHADFLRSNPHLWEDLNTDFLDAVALSHDIAPECFHVVERNIASRMEALDASEGYDVVHKQNLFDSVMRLTCSLVQHGRVNALRGLTRRGCYDSYREGQEKAQYPLTFVSMARYAFMVSPQRFLLTRAVACGGIEMVKWATNVFYKEDENTLTHTRAVNDLLCAIIRCEDLECMEYILPFYVECNESIQMDSKSTINYDIAHVAFKHAPVFRWLCGRDVYVNTYSPTFIQMEDFKVYHDSIRGYTRR